MINRNAKGARIEKMVADALVADGWTVHRAVRSRFNSNDVFGCIDIVAKKRGQATMWLQVTADGGIGRKAKEMMGIPWMPDDYVRIMRWKGEGTFAMYRLQDMTYPVILDSDYRRLGDIEITEPVERWP